MDDEQGYVSWAEAAIIAGCKVATVDWHTRTGRIKRRPKAGNRPSLHRASVEEFAAWYRSREDVQSARRAERDRVAEVRAQHRARAAELRIRPGRIPALSPDVAGWLTTAEAAAVLGVTTGTTTRLARRAGVRVERVGTRWWFDEQSIRTLAEERRAWMSFADAAALVGCSETAIATAIHNGLIKQRHVHRTQPSVARASVEDFAQVWQQRQTARMERHRPASAPPDDDHVWIDTTTTALLLDISRSRVGQLAAKERLPHVRRGQRLWFRREHIEGAAAARALTATRTPHV